MDVLRIIGCFAFYRDAAIFTASRFTVDVLLAKAVVCCYLYIQKISAVMNTSNTVFFTSNKNFNLPEIHLKGHF